jgi:signal transduction histidine kinase
MTAPLGGGPASDAGRWSRPLEWTSSPWTTWVAAGFVLFSLFALLIGPVLLNARTQSLRGAVVEPGDAARGEINDVRQAFTSGEAAARGLLLTLDERFLERMREAQAEERVAFDSLLSLTRQLDADLARRVESLRGQSERGARLRLELFEELRAGHVPAALLAREEERHERLLVESAAVKDEIIARTDAARAEIRRLERRGTLLTIVLALLALGAAAAVIRIGRNHRLRALAEAELRFAAFALTEATEVEDVLRRIAELSARPNRDESSYVERLDRDTDEVIVAASTGMGAPAVGIRVPYPGSLTEEAAAGGAPEIVLDIGGLDRPMSRVLGAACDRCVALAVPLLADGEPEGALVILRPPGSTFTDGEIQQRRALGILAALSLRKAYLLERARRQHETLLDMTKSRERLVRGFSHDVKNPLGAADGHAQLLADGVLGELEQRQKESVLRIRSGIASALELIENLIELARAEAGHVAMKTQEVDVAALVEETGRTYRGVADAIGIELAVETNGSLPTIRSDPERIRQVLGNLLSNALKFTPAGGEVRLTATPRVGQRARDPSRWVTLAVSDTGPGISEEEQDRLFTEFSRLRPRTAEGAGLGLAISDRVARMLGGDITLDSEPGVGSTFTLWLPADPPGQ